MREKTKSVTFLIGIIKNIFPGLLWIGLGVSLSSTVMATDCKHSKNLGLHGAYAALGYGYARNFAAEKTSALTDNSFAPLEQQNKSEIVGPLNRVDAGYIWSITHHWSWSLGGRLDYYANMTQSGQGRYDGTTSSYNYKYIIDAKSLNLVGRLIFSARRYELYGELISGAAFLNTSHYQPADASTIAYPQLKKQAVINPSYGFGGGVIFRITKKTSVGVNVDYNDLGSAKVGAPADLNGNLEQPLHTITTVFSMQQLF